VRWGSDGNAQIIGVVPDNKLFLNLEILPGVGAESAQKTLDPTSVPSDLLTERAKRGESSPP
jgi:hypothetical protein